MTELQIERLEKIKALAAQGLSIGEIAKESGITAPTVRKYNKQYNLKIYSRKVGHPCTTYSSELELYCHTHTMDEIKAKYGDVYHIVRDHKIPYIKRHFRTSKSIAIVNDLKNGIQQSVIAKKYGVTRQYVHIVKSRLESQLT